MIKKAHLLLCFIVLSFSCQNNTAIEKADNALDGGRYFIENYQQGDMKLAHAYMLEDAKNKAYFDEMSKAYFALDKEGRQQLRQSSIQINEVRSIDPNTSVIVYAYSNDQVQRWVKVVLTPEGWKVDLKYSYGPKL